MTDPDKDMAKDDNDLVDMTELRRVSERRALRRGRLSQLMIFVNGLVLTVTAFATLLIFLNQVKDARSQAFQTSLINDIRREFEAIDYALVLASLMDRREAQDAKILSDNKKIQTVLRATQDEAGKWRISYIQGGKLTASLKTVLPVIEDRIAGHHAVFISDMANETNLAVHRIADDTYMIAGLNMHWLSDVFQNDPYRPLYRLRLFDEVSGGQFVNYLNADAQNVRQNDLRHHIHSLQIAGSPLRLSVDVIDDPYFTLIGKLPYLLLLFGGTLTIVGTLYVRNNQKQAYQLELMNTALEDKNVALQSKIDESNALHKKLGAREHEYESVINAIQDIVFEIDATGHIQFVNTAWTDITHMDKAICVGKDLLRFLDKKDEDELRGILARFLGNQVPVRFMTAIRTDTGRYRAAEILFSVLHSDTGGQKRIVGTISDIEERRRAEMALDEAEKKYRTIVENAAGGIYQISLDGKVMSANPALAGILGFDSVGALMQADINIRNFFVLDNDRKIYEKAMTQDGFIRNHETQLRRTNGQIIWVNENARAVHDVDGTILYYEGSLEDITQRKQAEIALMEAKLNSDLASRAKSEFLANMSHELRTPLNAIIGFSEIIKGEALGEIAQKAYVDYARDIYSSGSRLLTVINEILGISKIEAGERHLNESVVDLRAVAQTCIDLLAAKIEASALDVNNIIPETLPPIVAEEMAFKQMMMNLLSNAIKFTSEGGTITLSSDYDGSGDLRLSITDTGVGIDDADIPKALSPFGQVDNAHSRRNMGTGLGLTLVDSLIRLHGGRLELVSQKGIGTTVTLVIPERRVAVKKVKESGASSGNVASLSDYKK